MSPARKFKIQLSSLLHFSITCKDLYSQYSETRTDFRNPVFPVFRSRYHWIIFFSLFFVTFSLSFFLFLCLSPSLFFSLQQRNTQYRSVSAENVNRDVSLCSPWTRYDIPRSFRIDDACVHNVTTLLRSCHKMLLVRFSPFKFSATYYRLSVI